MMNVRTIPLVLLALSLASLEAQTPDTTPAPASPAAKPSGDPTIPDGSKYGPDQKRLMGVKAQVAMFQSKPCDILFIGDSITAGWLGKGKAVWNKSYANRNALDFGVGGDTTQNVLWRMDNLGIDKLTPKVTVIMIGTNNKTNTPEAIASGVKAVITKTETMFPNTKIILVSITPNARAGATMTAADALIKDYADDKTVYFLDLVPLMPPVVTKKPDGTDDTNWKGMSPDHLA